MISAVYPSGVLTMDAEHVYRLGDRVVPSNTQILKDVGIVDTRYYNIEAALRGTYVHQASEIYCRNDGDFHWPAVDERYVGYVRGWERFVLESGFKSVLIEHPVIGPGFATTVDRVGWLNGRLVVLEIKTGSRPEWVVLQTALQLEAILSQRATLKLNPTQRFSVTLKPDGKYKLDDPHEEGARMEALALVSAWHTRKKYRGDVAW